MTWVAPARSSFGSLAGWLARATILRAGLSVRALSEIVLIQAELVVL